jgi:small subunit ribosomal protein S4
LGFAITRAEARQLVAHKTITVCRKNKERLISIPSFMIKPNDIIKIKNESNKQARIQHALMCAEKIGFVKWVEVDIENMTGTFIRLPDRSELSSDFNEQLIVEFYSK